MLRSRFFGPAGLCCAFVVMSALVIGGLGWVTVASLKVEAAQREARAQAERSREERHALWRLDGSVLPALSLETNRPFGHYTALHALYPVIDTEEDRLAVNSSRYPSPLLSGVLPEWMALHFQIDPETGWESPQVIPAELADRLTAPSLNLALTNVTPRREQLLAELRVKLPSAAVIRTLAEREKASPDESRFIVPVPFANETAVPKPQGLRPDDPPPSEYRGQGALAEFARAAAEARELRSAVQPWGAGRGGAVGRAPKRWAQVPAAPQAADPGNPAGPVPNLAANPAGQAAIPENQLDRVGTKGQQAGGKATEPGQALQSDDFNARQNTTNKSLARGAYDVTNQVLGNNRGSPQPTAGNASSAPAAGAVGPPAPPLPPSIPLPQLGGGLPGGAGGFGGQFGGPAPDTRAEGAEARATMGLGRPAESAKKTGEALFADSLRAVTEESSQRRLSPQGGAEGAGPRSLAQQRAIEDKDASKLNESIREGDANSGIAHARDGAGLDSAPPPAATPKAPPTVLPASVHVGPMRAHWLTATDGSEVLVLVRSATLEDKVVYQGVLLDWPAVRVALFESLGGMLPAADLHPVLTETEDVRDQAMTALPVRLDPGPMPEPAAVGWTPLRLGLLLAWVAALTALVAVGIGGRALVDLSERRIRFVSAVTHELRTPLTSLRLYLDLLNSGLVEDEEKKKEYLATLAQESDRLNRLIENVLDFARLEKRSVRAVMQPADVRELLAEVRTTWADRCAADGKELVVIATVPADQTVTTDRRMAVQILGVLVDNARKYSRDAEDGRIWVWARPGAKGWLVLEVEDRGPGVPLRERGSIFKPFRRGRTADTTAGGAGLGLALATHWADQLGGRLSYRAADGGTGACFRLELPGQA